MEQELFKAIFKIEGDSTSAIKALDEVNKKYEQSTDLVKDQQRELKKLQQEEAELMLGRAKANNPTQAAKYNRLLEEQAEKINKLKQYMAQTATETGKLKKEADTLNKSLGQAFDGARVAGLRGEVDKVNNSTKSLRTQLKELKAQLAVTTDDAEFIRLSAAAGQLQDKLNDATEAANIFATGSKFDSFGRALRGVTSDLINLDFEGASEKAKLLEKAAANITFKDGITGIKQFGSTLLTIGKSLLTNPIFLIGTVIALVITKFDELKKLGGPIGGFFRGIGDAISFVTNGLMALTDALGLTDNAFQKFNEARLKSNEEAMNAQAKFFERQAALYRAQGSDKLAEQAERNRLNAIIKGLDQEDKLRTEAFDRQVKSGIALTDEQIKQLDEIRDKREEAAVQLLALDLKQEREQREAAIREKERRKQAYEDESKREAAAVEYNLRIRKAENDAKDASNREYLSNQEQANLDAYTKEEALRKQREQDAIDGDNLFAELAAAEDERLQKSLEAKQAAAEKERQLREQRLQQELDGINNVTNAAVNSVSTIISAQQQLVDTQINLQTKRVQDTKSIAEKGNAELLELEQKRLDDLNAKRERFVRQQQTLALIELTANSTIAIAKAAAQGGAAAPFTIAATLLALGAGFIQARTLAASQGFYKGGYTGDGDPHGESTALGRKPYTYHKAEFVFNHEKTRKYKDIFDGIHTGNIDLREWQSKVDAFEAMRNSGGNTHVNIDIESLQSELKALRKTVENQSTYLNFDENGLSARFTGLKVRQDFIKNRLAK